MKLVEGDVEIWKQEPGIDGIYKQIERVGRLCYKSENLIKPGSAKPFVDRLAKAGHGKALEQGTVYLDSPEDIDFYKSNKFSKTFENYVSTNYRVLLENNKLGDLKYFVDDSNKIPVPIRRLAVHFTCDRGVSAEANRHTANSAMEVSTRYCNFSKGKFGNQLSIIVPDDIDQTKIPTSDLRSRFMELARSNGESWNEVDWWYFANEVCELSYMNLIRLGQKPQQARRILPLDLETELVHTAFISDWLHFLDLRCAKDAHPDIRKLALKIRKLMINEGLYY